MPEQKFRKLKTGEITAQDPEHIHHDQLLKSTLQNNLDSFGFFWSNQLGLFQKRYAIGKLLHFHHLYSQIIDTPGYIMEFGVHWGTSLATFINLRGLLEPQNYTRKIIGFDTFDGFPSVTNEDGEIPVAGDFNTIQDIEKTIHNVLSAHEALCGFDRIQNFELVKGDASTSIDAWLEQNPQAIIALAVFDMDLYEPTRDVLSKISDRLTKGSIVAFDELVHQAFPGETLALNEVFGINSVRLRRTQYLPYGSYFIVE